MNGPRPDAPEGFDIAEAQGAPRDVVDAQAEDERKRDAALASTYDPLLAHDGKTDEQLIQERQEGDRLLLDAVIVSGVILASAEADQDDEIDVEQDASEGGGE